MASMCKGGTAVFASHFEKASTVVNRKFISVDATASYEYASVCAVDNTVYKASIPSVILWLIPESGWIALKGGESMAVSAFPFLLDQTPTRSYWRLK